MTSARLILAIVVSLFVGLLLQTLVALLLFIYTDFTGGTGLVVMNGGRDVSSATGFVPPMDWNGKFLQRWWSVGKTRETISEMAWIGSRPGLVEGGGRQAYYSGFSAGWPLRSLGGTDSIDTSLASRAPWPLVDVPSWIKRGGFKVPVQPLWGGLLVNTAVFAVPVLGVVWGAAWWRRRGRLKRGECLTCGYPNLPGAVCPECGGHPARA